MPTAPQQHTFVPANVAQREAQRLFQTCDILFLIGSAGSGKTHSALAMALEEHTKRRKRIILTRPTAEAGESLGFLPGLLDEKMLPWLSPFSDVCRNLTFQKPAELFAQACEVVPLGYCRGRTFDHCTALLDEAQNASYSQLRMYLTRIGKGGKLILSGDPEQSDVPGEGFLEVVNRLEGLPGIGVVDFGDADIVRHPLIGSILDHLAD